MTVIAVVLAVTAGLVLLLGYAWTQGQPSTTTSEPSSSAPPAAVDAAHAALHLLGEECAPDAEPPADVAVAVDTIASFAGRYPKGRFPIDDETGTSVSLLLVARNALIDCAPAEAARLDALLPVELRQR
ncbi:hypothetical protein ROT00_07480 [Agromyces mediolanus]|uniref:hypothetical protein n=1 Tax=Agromyces mediolanus TaxID=41986 RepID=UPI00383315AD